MATAPARSPSENKSDFVRGYLGAHPKAGFRAVNQAWNESGREGSISESLINRLRSDLGLTGNLRARRSGVAKAGAGSKAGGAGRSKPRARADRPGRSAGADAPPASPAAAPQEKPATRAAAPPASLEAEFDRLLFRIMDRGMPDVEEAIRAARRLFVLHRGG